MDRARGTTGVVVWVLSVLLALIFIFAGVPKIVGGQTFLLQAAAMHGFPSWMRVVVGVFEVLGGLALLIPGLAIYGSIGLGILMIPAAITQAMSGESGLYIPFILFILLMIVGWQRDTATMRGLYRGVAAASGPVVREGVIAGLIGATCVAVWFFIIDLVAGHALLTPITLGQSFFSLFRNTQPAVSPLNALIGYTIVHYVAFAIAGVVAADVVAWAGREPTVLFGFAISVRRVRGGVLRIRGAAPAREFPGRARLAAGHGRQPDRLSRHGVLPLARASPTARAVRACVGLEANGGVRGQGLGIREQTSRPVTVHRDRPFDLFPGP